MLFRSSSIVQVFSTTFATLKLFWPKLHTPLLLQFIFLIFINLLGFIQPAALGLVIDQLTHTLSLNSSLTPLLLMLVAASILPSFLYTIQSYLNKITYLKLDQLMEQEYFKLNTTLDIPHHEDPQTKNLITRVNEDARWRIKNFLDRILYLFGDIFSLTLASIIVFQAQWWTLPLLLIATLPEFIASNRYGRGIWSISASQSEDRRTLWEFRNHYTYLPSLMELRLFQNLSYFKKKIISLYTKFFQQQLANEKKRTQSLLITQIGSQTVTAMIGVYFIFQVTQGQLSIGSLTFLISSVGRFRESLSGLLFHLSSQYQDSLFVADFFKLQQLPSSLDYSKASFVLPVHQTPTIQFHNVSFSYPHTSTPIIHQINLTIPPGSHVALIGANGAGKTTLIKLLCRVYDPTKGKITIDGTDLKHINLSSWYKLLGILSQEYAHFRLQAQENIILGNITQPHQPNHVMAAAKKASAHSFISKWPNQYHQQLGRDFTDGIEPSVGQWQKLALARLFYKNPKIYILDEPTSSLDPEAEAHIFKKLQSLSHDQTTISISHRFNTVKKASQIVVIKDGSIIEQGNHHQLLSLKGTYTHMYNTQAREYQE